MGEKYYLLSVKHSTKDKGDLLVWWNPDSRGYTQQLSEAGLYDYEEAVGIINQGLVPRGGYLARSAVMVAEDHPQLCGRDSITDTAVNLGMLGALEIWEAYHA